MRIAFSIPPSGTITSGPFLGASLEDDRLLEQLVRRDAIDLVLAPRSEDRTEHGWSFTLQRGGDRVAAMYRFGAWRGFVLVQFDDAALAPQIEAALRTATPDWRADGEVHCIAELFS